MFPACSSATTPGLVPDNNVATHLFRIAQEAISNAVKHGKARTIIVDLHDNGDELFLTIKDDGIGLQRAAGKPHGMGLRTMDYRARVIGGTLRVHPGAKGGTEIICIVRNRQVADTERPGYGQEKRGSGKTENQNPRGGRSSHRPRASG